MTEQIAFGVFPLPTSPILSVTVVKWPFVLRLLCALRVPQRVAPRCDVSHSQTTSTVYRLSRESFIFELAGLEGHLEGTLSLSSRCAKVNLVTLSYSSVTMDIKYRVTMGTLNYVKQVFS